MATKLENYVQLAGSTAAEVTKSTGNWTGFLATAANLYRYSFTDQLLIHAQRSNARACAEFDVWTKRMKHYVRRGSKGIALVEVKDGRPGLRYVFDIADTGRKKDSYNLYLWKYREEYQDAVAQMLEKHFGTSCSDRIEGQLCRTASRLAKDFWGNYSQDIIYGTEGSLLDGLDGHSLRVRFCETASFSITHILLLRCGFNPDNYFSNDVFQGISDFNTQNIIKILGHAVSGVSGDVLHQIAIAIFTYEREKKATQRTGNPKQPETGIKNKPENHTAESIRAPQPSIQEIYEQYKPAVKDFLMKDTAYLNACRNSDRENAFMEGLEAVRRAALSIKDFEFMKLFYDLAEFHGRMQQEVLDETYPELSRVQEQNQDTERPDEAAAGTGREKSAAAGPEPDSAERNQEESSAAPEPDTKTAQPAPGLDAASTPPPAAVLDGPEAEELPPAHAALNYRITDDHLGEGGAKDKYTFNTYAIVMLKKVESENRAAAPEEQEILAHYAGWGGIPDVFDQGRPEWSKEYQKLQSLLDTEEYGSARASVLNAHFTSPVIIKAMYEAVSSMGFKRGSILEPSCGTGSFFGCLPESMEGSKLYGVELDSISGRIAKLLYPEAEISVCGYEKTDFPKNFFDLAIGNVPFGQYRVNDPEYNRLGFSIHNYFIAKALDQVRPGGILAFVTSRYTMDAQNTDVRKYLAGRADFLGAVRLPRNAFKASAGTDTVADIIFLQKRGTPALEVPAWVQTEENADGFAVNRYFLSNPDMVLGRPSSRSTQYGRQEYTVLPVPDADLAAQLHEAVSKIHGSYQEYVPAGPDRKAEAAGIPADPSVKNYSFTLVKDDVYYRENSVMTKQELNQAARRRVAGMIHLRDCVHALIALQMDESTPDSAVAGKQAELSRLYDAFTCRYGLVSSRANRQAFDRDSAYYLLCSLEILDDDGNLQRRADMFTKRTIKPHKSVDHVDTASEALTVSIGERAAVDLPFMARLTGKPEEALIKDLHGVIFKDPAGNTWQTADEYLSGNVRRKLRLARKAAEQDAGYQVNVEALEAAQPEDLEASEIEVRIGATWIDRSYIQQFMHETLHTPPYLHNKIIVNYSAATAEWFITSKNSIPYNDVAAYTTYGTGRANAYEILEDSLNLRDVRIFDAVLDENGREKRVLNAKETTLAAQKQQALRDAFKNWIFQDPERRQELVKLYNELMNSTRPREYDGSHIVFSGINPEIQLQPHQANAVARVLYGGNALLAHEVGAGKTFELIASAMEAKRLGLCHKSIFVVPNHLTGQTASEFLRLYPAADLLVTTKKDFETANRKKFCARIATGDYDAVIIGHSQFEKIPLSMERRERLIQEQIDEITEGIREVKNSGGERFTIKQLEKAKKNLYARLEKLQAGSRKDDVVTFEQLGVDMMLVDESDSYKNLFLYTKMRNVAGLSSADAQKSSDMFAKCQYMDEITGGRGIVFATGTPISNSMAEMYTVMRYLMSGRLQELGMSHFDCWASRFGETVTALELAPEGTGYRARTRFARFFNLPELMNLFKEVADIKTSDQLNLPVPDAEYHNIAAKPTEIQKAMMKDLSRRAEKVHRGLDSRIDNMLKITSDGRKLGLDQRIINPMLPDEPGTKVNLCAANILRIWRDGDAEKLTQLVFCDVSTPSGKKSGTHKDAAFTNIYDDIYRKLTAGGMAPEQIAFIHQADTDLQKKELFAKVRSGQVRVLIGSTQKMGAGTNIQDRLIALHDLDCPWRPRDLIQREGRIRRRGNMNPLVHVYRYVTESTFDAYLWQTIENKQKFISQVMTSRSPARSCQDADETVLNFAEVKALCAGDPRIKERMTLDLDVSRLRIMKSDHQNRKYRMEDSLMKFPEQIQEARNFIAGMQSDIQTLKDHPHPEGGFAGMEISGMTYTERTAAGTALIDACHGITAADAVPSAVGSYRGFALSVKFSGYGYKLGIKGAVTYQAELGTDPRGNIARIDNVLDKITGQLEYYKTSLANLLQQQEAARAEADKPFPQEDELEQKSARLAELDAQLSIGTPDPEHAAEQDQA